MSEIINILIADDHAIVRKGLVALIESEPGMELVGEAADGVEVVQKAKTLRPDVVLLDLMMPRQDGLAAIAQIKQNDPNIRILVLTSFADDDKVFPAIKAGALGYLLKDSSPQQLLQAIYDVYQGQASLHPVIARKLIGELNRPPLELPPAGEPLTEREVDVLRLIAQGLSNMDIATELSISERTVRTHITHILDKLHLANRTQAALYAMREGLINSEVD
jgi:NarL family two-component system response regulator LiaR